MKCPRCHNLMVTDRFEDLHDDSGSLGFWALRCITCGEVIDPVILSNRTAQVPPSVKHMPRRKLPIALY